MSPVHGAAGPCMGTTAWAVTSLMSLDTRLSVQQGLGCSEQGLSPVSLLEDAQGALSHPPSAWCEGGSARQVPSAPLSRWHRHSGHQAASDAATPPSHCPQGAFAAGGMRQPQQTPELGRPLRGARSSVWGAGLVLLWVQLLSSRDDPWFNPLLALPSLLLGHWGGCRRGAGGFLLWPGLCCWGGGWQCWQQGSGHPGSSVSQPELSRSPGRQDGCLEFRPAWPRPSGTRCQEWGDGCCQSQQGHSPAWLPGHPCLSPLSARCAPAKGWVALLWLPERRGGSSPEVATGASAQPGCTCCLLASFAKHQGHTRIYGSVAHPRGRRWRPGTRWHPALLPLCSVCGWFG